MAPVVNICDKCNQALPPKHYMTCSICDIKLHIETCSIVTEKHYAYLSPKSRTDWKCGTCIWKKAHFVVTTPVRRDGPQCLIPRPTPNKGNNNSPCKLDATFTSATTKKNTNKMLSSPLQDKSTAVKKKAVTNVTLLTELMNFREQVSRYHNTQDKKFNDLATTLGEFKNSFTELNSKYISLRADVDNLCESLDAVNDKHDVLSNTVESTRLKLHQLQTEKQSFHNELNAAHITLTSLEQITPSEHSVSSCAAIEIDEIKDRSTCITEITQAEIHPPPKKVPKKVPTNTLSIKHKDVRRNDLDNDVPTKSVNNYTSPLSSSLDVATPCPIEPQITEDPGNDIPWQVVHHRRKLKRQGVIVGNAQQQPLQQPLLQAVGRTRKIHACFLNPNTTVDAMRLHMEEVCKQEDGFCAVKLKLKHDYYASFVLTVPECTFDVLMKPHSWPAGIEVCEWFHRGVRREHYSRPNMPDQKNEEMGNTNLPGLPKQSI